MKHSLLAAVGFAALLAVPAVASAQDATEGWYARGNLGYGAFADQDISGGMIGDAEAEGNAAYSLGVGYDLGNNWRIELDGSQMWNDMGSLGTAGGQTFSKFRGTGLLLNAIYDFDDFGGWAPYVGAGIGLMEGALSAEAHDRLAINPTTSCATNVGGSGSCSVSDSDTSTAWNLLAGLGYDISDKLVWDTNYRYTQAGDMDFGGIADTPISVKVDDIAAHQLMTGFRYRFGGTKAMPAPAPAPMPVADFRCWDGSMVVNAASCAPEPAPQPTIACWDGSLVFDATSCPAEPVVVQPTVTCWDGTLVYEQSSCPIQTVEQRLCGQEYVSQVIYYELNEPKSPESLDQMQDILNFDLCEVGSVSLVGHTDTVGSAAYNLDLSRRRAGNVKDELVKFGVPSAIIDTDGRGETDLLIPTADGVEEQLNRRVEVGIRLDSVSSAF